MFHTAGAKSNIVNIVNLKSINNALNLIHRSIARQKAPKHKSSEDQLPVPSVIDMEFNWSDKY